MCGMRLAGVPGVTENNHVSWCGSDVTKRSIDVMKSECVHVIKGIGAKLPLAVQRGLIARRPPERLLEVGKPKLRRDEAGASHLVLKLHGSYPLSPAHVPT
ncbi:unnamed protein product [Prorocentrum cordatum]|uniref:Uncharacterized protein n=1 Tax=Prorocentrum cordatum TaxID=2364126 RepID=A0ABN9Q5G0_9DINO|nr:unnamed protein product [Polarella glacialis]